MDILQKIIKNITYPFFLRHDGKKDSIKYLDYFKYLNNMDRQALIQSQKKRLHAILTHAFENTDHYRQLFDFIGLDVNSSDFFEKFRELPLLTKKIVKEKYDNLIAKNIKEDQITKASTGGSTGVPMYFLRDKECLYLRRGQELFFDNWMGYKIGKKMGYFVSGSHFDGRIQELKFKIRNMFTDRMISFDPHNITDEYMKAFLGDFNKFKPEIIKCFPNALTPFVHFVSKNKYKVAPIKTISCTGETLYKQQRNLFEEVFQAEVFEKVGTRESGVFACECSEHNGLHVFTEGVFMELIKPDGTNAATGEMGKVVITDLFNKAMPLIRYEIGDMAVSAGDEKCNCGSELPLIKSYLGRTRDIIIDSDGNPRPGYLFVEIIKNLDLNAQIQVYQPQKEQLKVRIVKDTSNEINLDSLINKFRHIVGNKVNVSAEYVSEIPRDPSGKFSYVKSDVKFL